MIYTCAIITEDIEEENTLTHFIGNHPELELECCIENIYKVSASINANLAFIGVNSAVLESGNQIRLLSGNFDYLVFVSGDLVDAAFSYDVGGIDFLSKPFDINRFDKSIDKMKEAVTRGKVVDIGTGDELFIPSKGSKIMTKRSELLAVESEANHVIIYEVHDTFKANVSISSFTLQVAAIPELVRVHRSFVINTSFIRKIHNKIIHLRHKDLKIPIGEAFTKELMDFVNRKTIS